AMEESGGDSFDFQSFKRALRFAIQSGAVALELSARGDPLAGEWTMLYQIISEASDLFGQVGLTTPGNRILQEKDSFVNLVGWHLTNLALVIPHHRPKERKALLGLDIDYGSLVPYLRQDCQVVVRALCFLSKKGVSSPQEALDYIHWCRQVGIEQVVFREIGTDQERANRKTARWCLDNAVELDADEDWNFEEGAQTLFYVNSLIAQNQARPIFVLPWGETVYDMGGVNVVFEKSESRYYGKFIKSLVFSSGHLYAGWESRGNILF
ncbi:MAG: hypothetical protein JRH07_08020, partial [Deltaproteobacteria bacterium]|nr:hypothetical protein [Deltaproteobacteria bacterium]